VTTRIREIAAAEEHRANALAARVTLGDEQAVIGFAQAGGESDQQLRTITELAQSAARPQITVAMEEIDRQQAARIASLRSQQIKVVTWAVLAWILPLAALYVFGPKLKRPQNRKVRRL
jgi:hypothetical protein